MTGGGPKDGVRSTARLRVTYQNPADLVADSDQQFSKGGFLVKVDPPDGLELYSTIELGLDLGRASVVFETQVVLVQPYGVAVSFDPSNDELTAMVEEARASGVDSGPEAQHYVLLPITGDPFATPKRSTPKRGIDTVKDVPRLTPDGYEDPPTIRDSKKLVPTYSVEVATIDDMSSLPDFAEFAEQYAEPVDEASYTDEPTLSEIDHSTVHAAVEELVAAGPVDDDQAGAIQDIEEQVDDQAGAIQDIEEQSALVDDEGSIHNYVIVDDEGSKHNYVMIDDDEEEFFADVVDEDSAGMPRAADGDDERAEKIRLAMEGTKQDRVEILRGNDRSLHKYVLQNPGLQFDEITFIARMATTTAEVLRIIAERRDWSSRQDTCMALIRNPKTPQSIAVRLVSGLGPGDLRIVARGAGIRPPIVRAAKSRLKKR